MANRADFTLFAALMEERIVMTKEIENLGNVIRRIRLQQKRTIKEIAEECGFSKSLLSKIENGKVLPPMATLSKIAQALRVKISTLLEEDGERSAIYNSAAEVAGKATLTKAGYTVFPFATDYRDKKIQPICIVARKGAVEKNRWSHGGEEFIYVIEGSLIFKVGATEYDLKKGDSLYFNSAEEHSISPTSAEVKYLNIFIQ